MNEKYVNRLTDELTKEGMDAFLVCPGEEFKFLTGINPMLCERFQGLFLKKNGELFYICNLLYEEELKSALPDSIKIYSWFDGEKMTDVVHEALSEQGLLGGKIGVNSTAQGFNLLEISANMEISFVNGKPLLERIRMIKDSEELDYLRYSAGIADKVFEKVLDIIRPGISEEEIQSFLMDNMVLLGGSTPECIVGCGANSSYPHYSDNRGVVGERDIVLLDYGCTYKGLYSDMSRTVFVGEPEDRIRDCYELVLRSNEAAEAMVEEGAYVPDIDKKAREVLDEKGYAHTLINRLGHGIGYMVHEAPDIKQSNKLKLQSGMAFSIEPGIYIAGDFGIRIEDIMIVNEEGRGERLNKAPKELIVI